LNYLILNGKKSTYVQGLLIQSLPPITKPKIRTERIEIDGRDGDIITELGYEAYDRQVTIGLYGNYDVDEVIRYFNSEGVATFSNEPYKYYNYKILDQIDLDKLIRFRQATVTFHVQPFKFSTVEPLRDYNTSGVQSIDIQNSGNYKAKPIITIYGSGTINLSLNDMQVFVINLGNEGHITIDVAEMEATKDNVLKNRLVIGNYDNLIFNIGVNTLTWTGSVTKIEIEHYSRWI